MRFIILTVLFNDKCQSSGNGRKVVNAVTWYTGYYDDRNEGANCGIKGTYNRTEIFREAQKIANAKNVEVTIISLKVSASCILMKDYKINPKRSPGRLREICPARTDEEGQKEGRILVSETTRKYRANRLKRYALDVSRLKNPEIIDHMEKQHNVQAYLRNLIKSDMKKGTENNA